MEPFDLDLLADCDDSEEERERPYIKESVTKSVLKDSIRAENSTSYNKSSHDSF